MVRDTISLSLIASSRFCVKSTRLYIPYTFKNEHIPYTFNKELHKISLRYTVLIIIVVYPDLYPKFTEY
jgi:hypothetical protein